VIEPNELGNYDFVEEAKKDMKWKISLSELNFDQREQKVVDQVIKRQWLTMGETVERLETNFAAFTGAKYAIALSSGTAALHLAVIVLGVKPGDEVIVPSLSFVASSNAILYAGAKPVFVDISALDDFNLSCEEAEKKITARTKAIMVVHYGGYLADMDRMTSVVFPFSPTRTWPPAREV
jgi:dTDP-4-amino-4,6-dideoxygalactose transaminase